MLGDIELKGIQRIHTEEDRRIVEHQVPGMEGSVLQDMGRSATAVFFEGIAHGEKALEEIEKLREKFKKHEPVTFTADITTATDITKVLIDDITINELAGRPACYGYRIKILEYIPPPPPAAGLDTDIGAEADAWGAGIPDNMELINDLTQTMQDIPNFGNPTEPLQGVLNKFSEGTKELPGIADDLKNLFGGEE